jgi:hypothetical protein
MKQVNSKNETGHIEYGQTSYDSTQVAIANLEEMLAKIKKGLMNTEPRIKCTLRIEVEAGQ